MNTNQTFFLKYLWIVVPATVLQLFLLNYSYELKTLIPAVSPESELVAINNWYFTVLISLLVFTWVITWPLLRGLVLQKYRLAIVSSVVILTIIVILAGMYIGYAPIFELGSEKHAY